jgi:parvulin-like peptidyl-prolyl isomerase
MTLMRGKEATSKQGALDAERERALAATLQDRGLKESAAETWLKYLEAKKLDAGERATVYYQVGKLFQEAGDFERALVNYYRSEAAAKVEDFQLELSRRKRECFRRLGNIAGLNQELAAMTALPGERKEGVGEVVAEIGPQKITLEEVNRRIDRLVDLQLKQYSAFMTPEQVSKQKEQLVDRFQNKQAKLKVLEDVVASEVLLREAIKRGLDKKPENDEAIEEYRNMFLANEVLDEEVAQKVNITESDLRDYYKAHEQDFRDKAKAEISQIVTEKEEDAAEALKKLREGKSFEECAKEFSFDEATKEKGGVVEGVIEKGGQIPGIGNNVDVHAHLFALKENEVSSKPVTVDNKFYVFKVRKVIPERIKTFDEVREEVERRKTQEKANEVREALIQRLQNEHSVIIHRSKFLPDKPEQKEEEKKPSPPPPPSGTI